MRSLFLTIAILLLATPAYANHLEFFWNKNTEADMKEYHLYQDSVTPCGPSKTLLAIVPQPATGTEVKTDVPHGLQGFGCVTAFDQSNNESGVSNTVPFDAKAPLVPGGLAVRAK